MLHLLVAIDTEGDNQWDAHAREHQTFENIYVLPRLHDRLLRHGVRPTYVITYPVARDERCASMLRELRTSGTCEIGAHHHAWETPPCTADDIKRHAYALSLPLTQFEEQLARLTEAIEVAVGERPVSYRSGRFGFSASHVYSLESAGYQVESSVAPLFYEAHKQGPDFVGAPLKPYFLAYDDATVPGTSSLLEIPVTAALNREVPAVVERLYGRAPRPYHTKRLLRAARVARVDWLRPSYSSQQEMIDLAKRVVARGVPVLNVLFHSSEAIVGGSPYNRTEAELDGFFERLDGFLSFAVKELDAIPVTLGEFRQRFCRVQ
jgi:hypothetical protein